MKNDLYNIFSMNELLDIEIGYIEPDASHSKFFIVDNFLKYPNQVVEYINLLTPHIHKENARPSFNTIYFYDLQTNIDNNDDLIPIYKFLSKLSGYTPKYYKDAVANLFRFEKHIFNNFYRNYWVPHKDPGGYTAILYLNIDDDYNGTNVYKPIDPNFEITEPEHHQPWIPREKYDVLLSVPPKYNRLFFFNASEYFHGMNIYDDMYTHSEYRTNLVFNMETVGFPY
jgi:hypothetical protein